MDILVLGASGLAGSAILRVLQAEGHTVSGTCRAVPDPTLLRFDSEQPQAIVPLLERVRPDVVVSCLRGEFTCQLELHRLLADFLHRHHKRLLYLSTANVFDGDLSRPHYEGDPPRSDSTYGQFKIACETLLRARLGDDLVILRPPEIWGTDCPRLRALITKLRASSPVVTYENLSVNYAVDTQIAQWAAFILEHDLRGIFHVGTRDLSDYTLFLERLAEELNLPRPHFDIELNDIPQYQAVLPGRQEIPARLQITVDDVLHRLANAPTLSFSVKTEPAAIRWVS